MKPRVLVSAALVTSVSSTAACGGSDGERQQRPATEAGAVTVTMRTRAATQAQGERLVEAYHKSHKNQVEPTVIPTDNYQPRIAAAEAGRLPGIFAADVILVPDHTSPGLFPNVTDRMNALPFKDSLAPSHLRLGTLDGKLPALSHTLDLYDRP